MNKYVQCLFPTIGNSNMAETRAFELGATLAQVPECSSRKKHINPSGNVNRAALVTIVTKLRPS
jgi:hypothetical protein